ncbi:hypothetical protein AVEN_81270-1 [Araneus ventricosus]|uniref:Uncharacterized protein n=1 Tax=Araneus ventricosus TaxID=182803 RepID=A0A4Y2FGF7_ARAVE|nr:hypothetical protein AVEN_81270-1 [Araneus ventricosus]
MGGKIICHKRVVTLSDACAENSWEFMRRLRYAICNKTGFFSPIQVERLGTSFTDVPKCSTDALRSPTPPSANQYYFSSCFETPCYTHPYSASPHAGSQYRQNICFPAALAARSLKGYPAILIRLLTIRNSEHSIHFRQFTSVCHTDKRFSFPVFQKSRNSTGVNAPLKDD